MNFNIQPGLGAAGRSSLGEETPFSPLVPSCDSQTLHKPPSTSGILPSCWPSLSLFLLTSTKVWSWSTSSSRASSWPPWRHGCSTGWPTVHPCSRKNKILIVAWKNATSNLEFQKYYCENRLEFLSYRRSTIFWNSILARTPRDLAWMPVMIRARRSSRISSRRPSKPALKNTWVTALERCLFCCIHSFYLTNL